MTHGAPPSDPSATGAAGASPVEVRCPSCHRAMRLPASRIRPGKFRVKCGACRTPFLVQVTSDRQVQALVDPSHPMPDNTSLTPEIAAALGLNPAAPGTRRPTPRAPKPRPAPPPPSAETPPPVESPRFSAEDFTPLPTNGDSDDHSDGQMTVDIPGRVDGEAVTSVQASVEEVETRPATGARSSSPSEGPSDALKAGGGLGPTLPPPVQSAGDRLGNYELRKKLGEGGMGAVYLARQLTLDRDVALKILSPRLSSAPALIGRFMREAYAAGQLVHHNVVQIHDFGRQAVGKGGSGKLVGAAGAGGEVHYFSMEFVDGGSLQNKLKELPEGRMEPREAVGLILQAARGLAFAHDHGLIHRDIKPDNLMLNRLGIVKVADLGLVKQLGVHDFDSESSGGNGDGEATNATLAATVARGSLSSAASAEITQAQAMMGTPAYLPPEQAVDAKNTDGRADIYALGCTLYHLLVGRPPFGGRTLQEVLDGHRFKPIKFPDPADGGPDVPKQLKEIVRRMCAKKPDERHESMDSVVADLEAYLRDNHEVQLAPDEQQVKTLQWAAAEFNRSTWAKIRPWVVGGFAAVIVAATVLCALLIPQPTLAFGASGGTLGFGVLTMLVGFVFVGMRRRDTLFSKTKEYFFSAGPLEWLIGLAAVVLAFWMLWNLGWLWWWVGAGVLAIGVAALYAAVVDGNVESDRNPMVARAGKVLRELREAGVDENVVKKAVVEAAGQNWEGFYEAMFGYREKLDARRTFGLDEQGREMPRERPWRDPILRWLEDRVERRRLKRDQKLMRALAESELLAQGIRKEVAEKQANNLANREVGKAALLREQIKAELRAELRQAVRAELAHNLKTVGDETVADEAGDSREREKWDDWTEVPRDEYGRPIRRRAVKYTDDDFERVHESYFKRRYGSVWEFLVGQQVRFIVAAVLLACFALWFNQNQQEILLGDVQLTAEVEPPSVIDRRLEERINRRSGPDAAPMAPTATAENEGAGDAIGWYVRPEQSLKLAGVSPAVTHWFSGWRTGLAGALLALSAFFYGRWLGVLTLATTAFALVAPTAWHEWLDLEPSLGWIPLAAAIVVWAATIFFLREEAE